MGAGSNLQCGLHAVWKDGFLPTAMHLPLLLQGIMILSLQRHPWDSEHLERCSSHLPDEGKGRRKELGQQQTRP